MQNQNQNQNVPKPVLPGQVINKPLESGVAPRTTVAPHNPPTKTTEKPKMLRKLGLPAKKPNSGFLTKIMVVVLAVLVLGLGGASAYFYLDLSGKVKKIDKKVSDDHNIVGENKDKIAKLETDFSSLDSLKEKFTELEKKTTDYAAKKDLDVVIAYLKLQDSDSDGLSDYDEVTVYKSNRLKKDTDGDGYSDKDEVDKGFNPNGPGKLGDTLTDEEAAVIVSSWSGSLWSTVAKAEDFNLTLSKDGKISGSFSFKKSDDLTIKNRVTGTFIYNGETGKFEGILVNYLSVEDKSKKDVKASEEGYKMNVSGSLAKESKTLLGTWEITGTPPAQWPAGQKGSLQIQRSASKTEEKLEEDTTEDSEMTKSYQTISVKAFSYGYLPTTITLTKDEKVKFEVTSLDTDHTFTVDDLGIDIKAQGGQMASLEYTPSTTGTYEFYSSISGQKDAGMKGTLVVKEKEE